MGRTVPRHHPHPPPLPRRTALDQQAGHTHSLSRLLRPHDGGGKITKPLEKKFCCRARCMCSKTSQGPKYTPCGTNGETTPPMPWAVAGCNASVLYHPLYPPIPPVAWGGGGGQGYSQVLRAGDGKGEVPRRNNLQWFRTKACNMGQKNATIGHLHLPFKCHLT